MMNKNIIKAKPFLKWAGGKTQLLDSIYNSLPSPIKKDNHFTYIEPFVGSGALLFSFLNHFPNLEKAIINDSNTDLIICYRTIKENVYKLIEVLKVLENEYHRFKDDFEERKKYYYTKRDLFNTRISDNSTQTALFIFLNRTCFNGLYRVNKSNFFNVPIGSYKAPMICDSQNLIAVSNALENVEILNEDFSETINHISDNTFFYFDPPYKPLNQTSSFNSYSKEDFNDEQQLRLRDFCSVLNEKGINWMLSNSDVSEQNVNNSFFDELFKEFNISRVRAKRSINANPDKRGELNELLITNYQYEQIVSVA